MGEREMQRELSWLFAMPTGYSWPVGMHFVVLCSKDLMKMLIQLYYLTTRCGG